ncbi:MAG TPA: DUF2807 domain-containing protein [Bacteroidales bacterium]|nr:DUF2807 domain-containing protein [Bacteroidales bacterium]
MNRTIFSVIIILALPISVIAQNFTVSPFNGVEAGGVFTVHLLQGENFDVTIDADESILQDVSVEVKDNILVLEYKGSARNIGRIVARVTAPVYLSINGSGLASFRGEQVLKSPTLNLQGSGATNITLQIETEKLYTTLSGATHANLSGISVSHTAKLSGASQLSAFGLVTESTQIKISGASKAWVDATTMLTGEASGASVLAIKEKPLSQNIELSGMAKVEGIDTAAFPKTTPEPDTVRMRLGPVEINVTDDMHITPQRNRNNNKFRDNWTGFELGINGYLTPDYSLTMPIGQEPFELRYEKSVAVNLNLFQQNINLFRNRLGLFTGIGIGWNNYRLGSDILMVKGPQQVEFAPVIEPGLRKNKLSITWINVPLMLEFQNQTSESGKPFYISAGINVGTRIRSHTKQVYITDNGRDKRKSRGDFYLNPFKFDLQARMGWDKFGMFASYSLNTLFRDGKAPELYPFSLGLRLTLF